MSETPLEVLRLPRIASKESKLTRVMKSDAKAGNPGGTRCSPFKICGLCSREFGSASLAIHQKSCKRKCTALSILARSGRSPVGTATPPIRKPRQQAASSESTLIACPVATCGRNLAPNGDLGPARECRPRPKTAVKSRSSLLASGHEVPVICNGHCTSAERGVVCTTCGECVPSFKIDAHSRACSLPRPHASLAFPARVREAEESDQPRQAAPQKTAPIHVTCSVCGRKYGTKSIAIHEPQCLKRRGRPSAASTSQPPGAERGGGSRMRSEADLVQAYFQYCYAEFEKELIPCSKCGRSFAPERHGKHIQNCNAKPLTATTTTTRRYI